MPLLRQALYSQNVNLYLAPTADDRPTWLPLMQTVALEGRCVVLSANQCMTKSNIPDWITKHEQQAHGENGKNPEETNGNSLPRLRRKSTITDEEGNEIVLSDERPPVSKLRRQSTITEDGHEIILPGTITEEQKPKPAGSEYISRGGSCIISPLGEVLQGPLWDEQDGLLAIDLDFDDCLRGRLDLDVGGSYSRYGKCTNPLFRC